MFEFGPVLLAGLVFSNGSESEQLGEMCGIFVAFNSTGIYHFNDGELRRSTYLDAAIPSFSYSSGDEYDEIQYAKEAAKRLSIVNTVRNQDSCTEKFRARLKRLVTHLGRGHSSPAIVCIDYLYESVNEKI